VDTLYWSVKDTPSIRHNTTKPEAWTRQVSGIVERITPIELKYKHFSFTVSGKSIASVATLLAILLERWL
jgi:hypothetical protein